ncbi:FAD-binding and (Fe-S)-binding domain-containing protein [Halorubellus salinus]|uniref:FAD-binding and (Fe-S)-binding domain-containing protein n=1 Tax=Halorubellus salinus TaxID=755309 RepID=UPI001D08E397|nr:FAD-binding and (Fe-S)-binding domain-containing protein [Halorubellus salinus]
MATEPNAPGRARDEASGYDYASDRVERPELASALRERVEGEVRFDEYSRELYATDASLYSVTPVGVVFPSSTADVAAVLSFCADEDIAVLPRGGGTSLAGQTVNEAVVLDFTTHMNAVRDVDPAGRRAVAQPGVLLGDLNRRLAEFDLKFAPDPAWGDKSALGGAVGNNSTGSHSLKYGKTDAYVESCEVVLADGTVTEFGAVSVAEAREKAAGDDLEAGIYAKVLEILDEDADLLRERYPDLKRSVSGYNLDWLVEDYAGGERGVGEPDGEGDVVNLAKLLCGSEGTLAVVTEVEIALEPVPETKAVALLCYDDLVEAMRDVAPILEHDPAAVELVDDVLLELARETPEFADVVGMLPEGASDVLLVEFYAEDDAAGERAVAELLADRVPNADATGDPGAGAVTTGDEPRAVAGLEAHEASERERFWKLRKSGLPILLSRTSDAKHASFIEDVAIPPEHLPEYVAAFQRVLDEHDTFASFYAHAGPGVLHVRPLVNTKTIEGVETMRSIADAVTDLVVEYGGSVSGEHGDGRARTEWNHKLFGDEVWERFQEVKSAFDPEWRLNPGQVCGDVEMTEHLRSGPGDDFDVGFEPALAWENENGLQGMVELCHGCGGCRGPQETTGGAMCPTYRAAEEEVTSTRGRANLLREAMQGDLPEDAHLSDEFREEVLDLCVGCKGCKRDCPSGVDMAKLKAEVTHAHHEREGASLREKAFANVDALARVGSALAPVSNWLAKAPGARTLLERTVGIGTERPLPSFERTTFRDWFEARGGSAVAPGEATRSVVLFPDTYTNYTNPGAGKAAVRVLEAAGVHVVVPGDVTDTGRPAHSMGFLDQARETASEVVEALAPYVRSGRDVVVVEPSDAVMLQSDYHDLLGADADSASTSRDAESVAAMEAVSGATYGVCEYLNAFSLDDRVAWRDPSEHDASADSGEHVAYHGHCHQQATKKDHHAVGVLRRAGYRVDALDSGCCGMAGSFGYEREHEAMSSAIADILYDQVDASDADSVIAPGASCRTQLAAREDADAYPPTPVEALAAALPDARSGGEQR